MTIGSSREQRSKNGPPMTAIRISTNQKVLTVMTWKRAAVMTRARVEKKVKPGRRAREIAAARQCTLPTTGSKFASAAAKKRERSARSVSYKPCLDNRLTFSVKTKVLNLTMFQPRKLKSRTYRLRAFVLDGTPLRKQHQRPQPITSTIKMITHRCSMEASLAITKTMGLNVWQL
jgi:hypothetical protein